MARQQRVDAYAPTAMGHSARAAIAVAAFANFSLAVGYVLQQPWAVRMWPWETGRLSYIFLAAMLTAVGLAAAWIAISGETGSLPAGFLNLTVTLGGIAIYPTLWGTTPDVPLAVAIAGLALINLALFRWTRRLPQPSSDPVPRIVRVSFVGFTLILAVVGIALLLRRPGVMPWPIDPDTSAVFGWMFFGDAWYFAYAAARPNWASARAQLWSFLGYDLVLFLPLAATLADPPPDLRVNVLVYLAVLAYSGALALYFLILNPASRGWGGRHAHRLSSSP